MKNVILAFALISSSLASAASCPQYSKAPGVASLSGLNPPARQYGGISYPSQQQTLFRGAMESNATFNLEKVLQGIFKEPSWYIGSPLFFGITQVLTGQWDLDRTFFPSGGLPLQMREYFRARKILGDIETLLRCQDSYSVAEANDLAADLSNKVFQRMDSHRIEQTFFDMSDSSYYAANAQALGFGNNAVDFIISTTYDQISTLYGSKTLVYRDSQNRSLDLTFYNRQKNGYFVDAWVDKGEVNTPGYITSDDILGFQQRNKDRQRADANWADPNKNSRVVYAVYKAKYKGETVALILDGQNAACIVEGSDQKYYECVPYWTTSFTSKEIMQPFPKAGHTQIGLLGVVTGCEGKNCIDPQEVIKWYGKSSSSTLDARVSKRMAGVVVKGNPLKVTLVKGIAGVAKTIKVVSASYLTASEEAKNVSGNVTAFAARFADGNENVTFKVSHRFLGKPAPTEEMSFTVKWYCLDNPKAMKTKTVPRPAENKSFEMDCD